MTRKKPKTEAQILKDCNALHRALTVQFRLTQWSITVKAADPSECSPAVGGSIFTTEDYFIAGVELNIVYLSDAPDVKYWYTLLHEFAHILLSEYECLHAFAHTKVGMQSEHAEINRLFRTADERSTEMTVMSWIASAPDDVVNAADFAKYMMAKSDTITPASQVR